MIRIVHSESEVRAQVERVAEEIAATGVQELLLIMMLRGGVFFGCDLARRLSIKGIDIELDFMSISF
jgi:hypoxanthine phosphoribosyltransferase